MAKKPKKLAARSVSAEQLVPPFELKIVDVVVEDGVRLEVTGRLTGLCGGKIMRAKVRDPETRVQHEAVWSA